MRPIWTHVSVWADSQVNWATQDNALYLEDYYQGLERLVLPDLTLEVLSQLVNEHPGISLSDLRSISSISADLINIAIASHNST